jgi:MFS family permease
LQQSLELAPWHISLFFTIAGLSSIILLQITGRLADKYGARRVGVFGIIPRAVGPLIFAFAPDLWWLLFAGVCLGAGAGCLDVAVNVLGVQAERRRQRPVMSFLHGMWAVGNLLGALATVVVSQIFKLTPVPTMHVVVMGAAIIGAFAFTAAWIITPETEFSEPQRDAHGKVRLPIAAIMLALMAIPIGLAEGVAFDWPAIHIATVTQVDSSTASLGVTAMSLLFMIIRLVGDPIVAKLGRRTTVRAGCVVAIAGFLITAFGSGLVLLLGGWALVGMGLGIISPQIYGAAAHIGSGRGFATVVTFNYGTSLVAPLMIGLLIEFIGIQYAMIPTAALLSALLFFAKAMP